MSVFILLSGAWHGAWCWERVAPALERSGHQVLTPDLLGMGDDATPLAHVTLGTWTDQIADLVQRQPDPVIIVAHSRGGIIASEVAERIPDRIRRLVYLTGSLIPDGGSIATHGPKGDPEHVAALMDLHDDGSATIKPDAARHIFYNATPQTWVERALSKLGREPVGVFQEAVHLSSSRYGQVKRTYIETLRDNAVPIEVQKSWQAALPCDPVFTLDTDHASFFSQPDEVVKCLV